jgi:hypothetical protein
MSKHNFLDCLCLSVYEGKIKQFCKLAEFDERKTKIVIEKFCHRKNIDVVAPLVAMSVDQLQDLMPQLCDQAFSCFSDNLNFFTAYEVLSIGGRYAKLK